MRRFSGAMLASLLFYGIAVLWLPHRWFWAAFQLGIFALAAAWLLAALLQRRTPVWSASLLPIAGVPAWGLLQLLTGHTVYRWSTWLALLDWFTFLATAFVALQVLRDSHLRHRFLRAVAWFALVLGAVAATQMFTSGGKVYWLFESGYQDVVLGPFVYRNQYSAFIELLLPVVLWNAVVDRRRAWRYWIIAGVMFASVIAGASRAGAVLVSIEIVVFLVFAAAARRIDITQAGRALAMVLIFAALFTGVVGWETLWNRLRQPDPFAGRREILASSVRMFRERPLWGFGLGAWSAAYPRFATWDNGTFVNQAHDDWIQWAAEGGVPLLLLLALLAVMVFRPAIRSLWGLGVLFELVHCAVDYPLQQRPALAVWFFVFAAIAVQSGRPCAMLSGSDGRHDHESETIPRDSARGAGAGRAVS
jgi:O-antigen ligase